MKIINNLKLSAFASRGVFASIGVAAVVTVTTLVVTALATPNSGVSGPVVARASFAERVDIKLKLKGDHQEVIHVRDALDTVMRQIFIAPNGNTGWHSHHGPAVVMIAAGELTIYSSEDPTCTGSTYLEGEAFIESPGHVHIGVNNSEIEVELWVTFFDVPPGQSPRVDAADPGNCGF